MNDDLNRSQLNTLKNELQRVEMDLRMLRAKADQIETRIAYQERATTAPPVIQTPPPVPPIILAPEPEPEPAPLVYETPLAPEPPPPQSFEMRLGTYWFVRIGVVMVLTALVFLGNYAYHHYVGLLGPMGKLLLMYAASAGLLAAGAILPRKQERLANYGQVLFAGGLAAIYFTTYAAHHFPNLQIIKSALLDGLLLLGWTSYIVWLADRKKSEVLAVFAIGLAYYTALITNVGSFTLLSNLLLAVAAVFFLVRNRWVTLTFLSLAASYGSYFYWRYYAGWTGIDEFAGRFSIGGYWTIFTAAVFLTRHELFGGTRRASFLSLNNGAAFALLTLSFLHQHSGRFWQLSLASGAILLALAALARKILTEDTYASRAYLTQGLFLLTLGLIIKLSGPTLALVLAIESALLLVFATQWNSRLLRGAAAIVAALSAGWFIFNIGPNDPNAWARSAGIFALLLFDAFWSGKQSESVPNNFRAPPAYFTVLALLTWIGAIFTLAQPHEIAPILAATTIVLTALHYPLRVREITLLAQIPLLVGQGHTFILLADHHAEHPASALFVIAISLGLAALAWKSSPLRSAAHLYQSAAAILTLMFVTVHVAQPSQFIALAALFAIFLLAALAGARYTLFPGLFLAASGLCIWLSHWHANGADPQNFAAILIVGASQFALRKKSETLPLPEAAHNLWIAVTAGALWLFLSRWVIVHSSGAHFYLTASWAALAFALFGIGFALCERAYRWAALTVLAAALCRVVLLDVWKLETLYRILSFFALGIVLLALGYFYTRFQERIAKWL